MAAKKAVAGGAADRQLLNAVAIALFRMDRATTPGEGAAEVTWKDAKPEYLKRGRRLVKSFEREKIALAITDDGADGAADAS